MGVSIEVSPTGVDRNFLARFLILTRFSQLPQIHLPAIDSRPIALMIKTAVTRSISPRPAPPPDHHLPLVLSRSQVRKICWGNQKSRWQRGVCWLWLAHPLDVGQTPPVFLLPLESIRNLSPLISSQRILSRKCVREYHYGSLCARKVYSDSGPIISYKLLETFTDSVNSFEESKYISLVPGYWLVISTPVWGQEWPGFNVATPWGGPVQSTHSRVRVNILIMALIQRLVPQGQTSLTSISKNYLNLVYRFARLVPRFFLAYHLTSSLTPGGPYALLDHTRLPSARPSSIQDPKALGEAFSHTQAPTIQ